MAQAERGVMQLAKAAVPTDETPKWRLTGSPTTCSAYSRISWVAATVMKGASRGAICPFFLYFVEFGSPATDPDCFIGIVVKCELLLGPLGCQRSATGCAGTLGGNRTTSATVRFVGAVCCFLLCDRLPPVVCKLSRDCSLATNHQQLLAQKSLKTPARTCSKVKKLRRSFVNKHSWPLADEQTILCQRAFIRQLRESTMDEMRDMINKEGGGSDQQSTGMALRHPFFSCCRRLLGRRLSYPYP